MQARTIYETVDKGHGRIEKRTYCLSSDLSGLENAADWSGLSGFGMVRSQAAVGEAVSSEIRYAITSLKFDAATVPPFFVSLDNPFIARYNGAGGVHEEILGGAGVRGALGCGGAGSAGNSL